MVVDLIGLVCGGKPNATNVEIAYLSKSCRHFEFEDFSKISSVSDIQFWDASKRTR